VLEELVRRRAGGEPLEQVLGWAAFCGLRILVEPGVFVPRRRTELVVREVLSACRGRAQPVLVDLCCGSGAVGAALQAALSSAQVYAADVDPAAVRCARRNLAPDRVLEGDLYDALPPALRHRVDVLAVNTPYVPTYAIATMPLEARVFEPRVALDGGPDGLDVARRVAARAPEWLAPGGELVVETSARQAPVLAEELSAAGLAPRVVRSDDLDATVVVGRRLGGPR
jgi:release factor glutamine methyltransferase